MGSLSPVRLSNSGEGVTDIRHHLLGLLAQVGSHGGASDVVNTASPAPDGMEKAIRLAAWRPGRSA